MRITAIYQDETAQKVHIPEVISMKTCFYHYPPVGAEVTHTEALKITMVTKGGAPTDMDTEMVVLILHMITKIVN